MHLTSYRRRLKPDSTVNTNYCGSSSARSHMERLSYFVHNSRITAEVFYEPLLKQLLGTLGDSKIELTLEDV